MWVNLTVFMHWFEDLFGVKENPDHLSYDSSKRLLRVGDKSYPAGDFSLHYLSDPSLPPDCPVAQTSTYPSGLRRISGNISVLERNPAVTGDTFQVASNANCLEFAHEDCSKLQGITHYAIDSTQGPAATFPAPVALLYRNYFLSPTTTSHEPGQQPDVNLFEKFPDMFVKGGKPSLGKTLPSAYNDYTKYAVGVHTNSQILPEGHYIHHVFCCALPLYGTTSQMQNILTMEKYVLRAQYRLTLLAAIENHSKRCFLTYVGTGYFDVPGYFVNDALQYNEDLINSGKVQVFLVDYSDDTDPIPE